MDGGYRLGCVEAAPMRSLRVLFAVLVLAAVGAAPGAQQVTVKLIAINDFHGYTEPTETFGVPDPANPGKTLRVPVGGAAYLASEIARLRAKNPLNAVVGAGDMVGASPLTSALFHDEPTIQALNMMGLEYTSVGNHEFDEGRAELLRKQHGGCRPGGKVGVDTCLIDGKFAGAKYEYLAANVIDETTGKTLFPAYAIKTFDAGAGKRISIAFVGVVLKETPSIVTASGVAGLKFTDEAAAVNALLPELNKLGVHAVVVLIHQGIFTKVGYNDPSCGGAGGDLIPILNKLDPSVRLVISGHTHWPYICPNGQGTTNPHVFYSSAGRYGQIVSDVDVTLDVAHDTIANVTAQNDLVINDKAPNPLASTLPAITPVLAIADLVARYHAATAPLVGRVIGHITADIDGDGADVRHNGTGESAIGDLVADSRLAATQAAPTSAQLAVINGVGAGIRNVLHYSALSGEKAPGDVTFGEAYNVLPFGDELFTETLTGAQLIALFDEQWVGKTEIDLLAISHNVHFTWDAALPDGTSKLVPGSLTIDGVPVNPTAAYRVTIDAFLGGGGDKYLILQNGTSRIPGPVDLQALDAYITAHTPLTPATHDRITRLH